LIFSVTRRAFATERTFLANNKNNDDVRHCHDDERNQIQRDKEKIHICLEETRFDQTVVVVVVVVMDLPVLYVGSIATDWHASNSIDISQVELSRGECHGNDP
jgi:hypothetical protein